MFCAPYRDMNGDTLPAITLPEHAEVLRDAVIQNAITGIMADPSLDDYDKVWQIRWEVYKRYGIDRAFGIGIEDMLNTSKISPCVHIWQMNVMDLIRTNLDWTKQYQTEVVNQNPYNPAALDYIDTRGNTVEFWDEFQKNFKLNTEKLVTNPLMQSAENLGTVVKWLPWIALGLGAAFLWNNANKFNKR